MRHLRSILYALVLAPAVWTLCAVGFTHDLTGRARTEGTVETLSGLLLLLLAGAAYAILLLPRLSPAGPVLGALVFLAAVVWVVIDPASFDGLWPAAVRKEGFDLTLPADGLAALLAVPLLCTALIVRRWREPQREHRPAPSIQAPFGGQFVHRRAGFDAIGLGTGEATQVLGVGRPEEATQIISSSRSGVRTPGPATAGTDATAPARDSDAGADTGVTEPVVRATGDTDATEPITAASPDADATEPITPADGDTDATEPVRARSGDARADTTDRVAAGAGTPPIRSGPSRNTDASTPDTEAASASATESVRAGVTTPDAEAAERGSPPTEPVTAPSEATEPDREVTASAAHDTAPTPNVAASAANHTAPDQNTTAGATNHTGPPDEASHDAGERTVEQVPASAPAAAGRTDDPDPDGRTVALDVHLGDDRTQVIPVGLGRFGNRDGERTQEIGVRGGELEGKTQIIAPVRAGERSTSGTVTPPAENTQVLGIPVAGTPGERTTVRRTPADRRAALARDGGQTVDLAAADNRPTADITAGEDRPTADIAAGNDRPTADITARDDRPTADITPRDDRPTVAIPAPRAPDDEPTTVLGAAPWRGLDGPTTDLGAGTSDDRESTRPMTVGGLERPADEVAADTARRTGQATQRRAAAVPAQSSRSRTSGGAAHDDEPTRQL